MKIYIEIVLIVNLLIHLFTILIIKEITYLKFSKLLILTIPIDIIYMLGYIYGFDFFILKYVIPLIYVLLSFKSTLYMYIKVYLIYFFISYLLGGISTTLNISGNLGYLTIFLIYLVVVFTIYFFFKRKDIFITYKIEYVFKEKVIRLNAFFDTGCNLIYQRYPVIILNTKYHFKIHSDNYISFSSGSGIVREKVYLINRLKINKKIIKCYCIFLDIEYDAIIGSNVIDI